MMHIRKNDTVIIISGSYKGQKGQVIEILPKKNRIKVSGVGIVKKHAKARKQGEVSSIKEMEKYIPISKVMLVSSADSKPSRIGFKILEGGKKVRICKLTDQVID